MTTIFGLAPQWAWVIAAALFGIGEMAIPGIFLIWIGLAAAITAVAAFLLPISFAAQFLVFAVAAFASVYAGRKVVARTHIESSDPLLNDRAARLIGEIVTAASVVDSGQGRVKVGDGVWSAKGTNAQPGDRLRVVGIEGSVLLVEPV